MAAPQAYSIAELSRCKLLYEASVKDRDLRRLVGHVNMYDRLLDVLNGEEVTRRQQSPPKVIPRDANTTSIKFAGSSSPDLSIEKESLEHVADPVTTQKWTEMLAYRMHCENSSSRRHDGYSAVSVEEVELLEDED